MYLAHRAYVLLLLTAVVAIVGLWASWPAMTSLWCVPAGVLLAGLAWEAWRLQRTGLQLDVRTAPQAFLGRAQRAAFTFRHDGARALWLHYAPDLPAGVLPVFDAARSVYAPPGFEYRDEFALVPTRLGVHAWPDVRLRLLGHLGLAWWARSGSCSLRLRVAPDIWGPRARPRGQPVGERPRRRPGSGAELHQLRAYRRGDPPAWIDWKATARSRALTTREFTEDQHLDVLIAVDAGRASRIRCGLLERFGAYANLAARLAERVVRNDDRVGLVVFADHTLEVCPPARGRPAVMALRAALERQWALATESDPLAAATAIRSLLRRRTLILLLTDLDDVTAAAPLQRAVRLLSPPHLVIAAGVTSADIAQLVGRPARRWLDPWIVLAAQEHQMRAQSQRLVLQRLGVVAIAAPQERLESAVLARYAALRRSRRI